MPKHINKNLFSILIFTSALLFSGCKKVFENFGDLNSDPNGTNSPVLSALLTNALTGLNNNTSNAIFDQGGFRTINGMYAQYFTETQYTEFARYSKTTINYDDVYAGPLNDLQTIINRINEDNNVVRDVNGANSLNTGLDSAYRSSLLGIAEILRAYYFWQLTDTWGDIPYSEALKGKGNVRYDSQDSIYYDLIMQLKSSVQKLNNNPKIDGDILFNGDNLKWKKLANSMQLLMALRMSKADPIKGKRIFMEALQNESGVIDDIDGKDNAVIASPGGTYQNTFYNYYEVVQRKDYALTKTVTDILKSTGDSRIKVFGSSEVGFPYGLLRTDAVVFANDNLQWARILAPDFRLEKSPIVILAADQIKLARAEAALLGWTTEDANKLYQEAIEANWKRWGVYIAVDFNNFINQPIIKLTIGINSTQELLDKIALQRWLAFYPDGTQGFAEWRRTGIPLLEPAPGMSKIPRRLVYGPNDAQLNTTNYLKVASKYKDASGIDSQFGRVWWDK